MWRTPQLRPSSSPARQALLLLRARLSLPTPAAPAALVSLVSQIAGPRCLANMLVPPACTPSASDWLSTHAALRRMPHRLLLPASEWRLQCYTWQSDVLSPQQWPKSDTASASAILTILLSAAATAASRSSRYARLAVLICPSLTQPQGHLHPVAMFIGPDKSYRIMPSICQTVSTVGILEGPCIEHERSGYVVLWRSYNGGIHSRCRATACRACSVRLDADTRYCNSHNGDYTGGNHSGHNHTHRC